MYWKYLLLQAGLQIGDMILAVNRDSLLSCSYDGVSQLIKSKVRVQAAGIYVHCQVTVILVWVYFIRNKNVVLTKIYFDISWDI